MPYEWLPSLVCHEEYGGDWNIYLEVIYGCFREDFIESQPWLVDRRVAVNRATIHDGKELTFWHIISDGPIEEDRLPDFRRCECIRWPRSIIDAYSTANRVYYWEEKRGSQKWILLALRDFSYVVVFAERKGYIVLWTAYCIERQHKMDKLKKNWEAYWKDK